jgi:acyl carrier protein
MSETQTALVQSAVRAEVVECIRRMLPPGEVIEIDDTTNPILDLGLDSVDGVDLVVVLGEKLGFDFDDAFNPFVSSDNRARDLGQIVEVVSATMTPRQESAL